MPPELKVPHRKLPPGTVLHTRQPMPPGTTDEEREQPGFEELALKQFASAVGVIARMAENRGSPVDEYNSAAITGAGSSASVSVQPTYELMPEKIEGIIVTGPTGAITLTLGDRIWSLTIPASGILVIAPIAIRLGRTDVRQLTSGTPGTYTLELMGIGDRRFSV